MKLYFGKVFAVSLIFLSIFFNACNGNNLPSDANSNSADSAPKANVNANNSVKDTFAEFTQYVSINTEPDEIVWREDKIGQADNSANGKRKINAVLRFLPEDTPKFYERLTAAGNGKPAVLETEDWYPAELIAQSQISGDGTVKGTSFVVQDLPIAPFTQAVVTRIENSEYFIIELTD